jgi:hypothetical protein
MDKKKIINIAAIVIGGFIAYKLITKKSDSSTSDNGGSTGGGGNEGGGTGGTGGGSGSGLNYTSLANDIFAAFDGYGTRESNIYDTFSLLKSDKDFDELVKAYGVREISSGKWNWSENFTGDLIGAIKNELTTSEIEKVNETLKNNGVSKKIV